jgi:hypothetical protein
VCYGVDVGVGVLHVDFQSDIVDDYADLGISTSCDM